ncbi:MAG: helix-turn-helix transcriptional regulator [Beijerinckiaceae bacterium]|nr:helix-turn-helix transcriptional regulator [Beijerinckiaceae bacterium]
MKLQDYLRDRNIKPARFAAELGVPASTVSRLLNGERQPGIKLMERIAGATNGAVSPNDFMDSPPPFPDAGGRADTEKAAAE